MADYAAVLMYHHVGDPPPGVRLWGLYVSKLNFAFQMWYLKTAGFRVRSLGEFIGAVSNGALEPYTVVLTFDDGFCDFYVNAFPVLKKYGLPATVFSVTGQAGMVSEWEDIDSAGRGKLMDASQMKEIMLGSRVEFAPHTAGHKKLSALPADEEFSEIESSVKAISELAGADPVSFAAPYGDYGNSTREILKKLGIKCALTTENRAFDIRRDDLFSVPRVIVRRNNHPPGFAYKMARIFRKGK